MKSNKQSILILIDWYLPAYKAGGPIKSIYSLCMALKEECDFYILCSDKDLGDKNPLPGIETQNWTDREEAKVMYMPAKALTKNFYRKFFNDHDFDRIYLNSLFSFRFSLLPIRELRKMDVKVILAPRGMLGPGALAIKPIKKKVFLAIARLGRIFSKIRWHSTAGSESEEIKSNIGDSAEIIEARNFSASNIPNDYRHSNNKVEGILKLFFLSRISKKKNLLGALNLLLNLKTSSTIEFHVIGPVEEKDYFEECQNIIAGLPANFKVKLHGAIENSDLHLLLRDMHFLLLPTFHENYGHVIVESWSMGCPVLISDQTPWQNLAAKSLGWEIPLNEEKTWLEILSACINMDQEEFSVLSNRSRQYALGMQEDIELKNKYIALFE